MAFKGLWRRITTFFGQSKRQSDDDARLYVRRHHAFKLFLSAWNAFQEDLSELRYTLCCDHPFGLNRVRALCTSMATQVFQCIRRLEDLDPAPCDALFERFNVLQHQVVDEFKEPKTHLTGALVIPLGDPDLLKTSLVDPGTLRLESLRYEEPNVIPQGFILTQAGCQHYFQHNDLQKEINRQIQAAGGLEPKHLHTLAKKLAKLIISTPLPEELAKDIHKELTRLRSLDPTLQLLLRGRVWPPEADENCGIILWGPPIDLAAPDAAIFEAILKTLARKQGAQCQVYRRARGLTDAGTGMCLTCLAVPKGSCGGLAQSCAPLRPNSRNTHVYACAGLPQELEYSALPVDRVSVSRASPHLVTKRYPHNPNHPVLDDTIAIAAARLARIVEEKAGCPQVLTWLSTQDKRLFLLMTRPMTRPLALEMPSATSELQDKLILQGGFLVSPGHVFGSVVLAKTWEDVRRFPQGAILVVPDDAYIWGGLIDRLGGLITERGFQGSRLASLAREFGKPALFGVDQACSLLHTGQEVTLCADLGQVYSGRQATLLPKKPAGRDYLPGSPVYRLLEKTCRHILPLTLDIESLDFQAANCVTYHDIVSYCHERAIKAMFNVGHDPFRVKQLRDQVVKQFWVVNLGDGFAKTTKEPVIDVQDITSKPMLALAWDAKFPLGWACG